jgi:hypothetical protein
MWEASQLRGDPAADFIGDFQPEAPLSKDGVDMKNILAELRFLEGLGADARAWVQAMDMDLLQ